MVSSKFWLLLKKEGHFSTRGACKGRFNCRTRCSWWQSNRCFYSQKRIFLFSELNRKKSFQSSSSYAPFCPDKTGALSLKDYQSLQNHEQYVQTLKECGFTPEEIQFKLEQEGYVPKVSVFQEITRKSRLWFSDPHFKTLMSIGVSAHCGHLIIAYLFYPKDFF